MVIKIEEQQQTVQVFFNDAVGLNETYTGEGPYNPIEMGDIFLVGFDDPEEKKQFFGKMADFNVWNRSLTQSEVLSYTLHCTEVDKTGMVAIFKPNFITIIWPNFCPHLHQTFGSTGTN